jgi:hypothetical protein
MNSHPKNQRRRKASTPTTNAHTRLTLAQAAAFVVAEVWPRDREIRLLTDRVRKRIKRDVASQRLTPQKDGTFELLDLANWLRKTWWTGMGRPGDFPNLPGQRNDPWARYADKKGRLRGITLEVIQSKYDSDFDKLTTVEACHQEIRRLNELLTRRTESYDRLYDQLPDERRRVAQQEGGRKGAERRWRNKR